jgi:hypothetical protein
MQLLFVLFKIDLLQHGSALLANVMVHEIGHLLLESTDVGLVRTGKSSEVPTREWFPPSDYVPMTCDQDSYFEMFVF